MLEDDLAALVYALKAKITKHDLVNNFGDLVLWCIRNKCIFDLGDADLTYTQWTSTKLTLFAQWLKLEQLQADLVHFGPDEDVLGVEPSLKYWSPAKLMADVGRSMFASVDIFPDVTRVKPSSHASKNLRLHWLKFTNSADESPPASPPIAKQNKVAAKRPAPHTCCLRCILTQSDPHTQGEGRGGRGLDRTSWSPGTAARAQWEKSAR